MSKRLAIVFFVVIGFCIFLVAGFCLTLFLAPGFSAFGVKYIRSDIHLVNTGKYYLSDTKVMNGDQHLGNIIVETSEVPVNVIYTEDHEYAFEYYDNYSGFTTSKFDDPSLSITKDEEGNIVFKVTEYKKFVYESSSSKRYFNIYVPLLLVSDATGYSKSLTVKTGSATISFSKEVEDDARVPAHNTLSIITKSGKIKYKNTNVRATTLNITTNNTIKLYGDANKEAFATHYNLESKLGRIIIKGNVSGNVSAKTNSGDIELISCKNLKVETSFGDLLSSANGGKINVQGIVNIKTKAGSVTLGDVNGSGKSTILTGGGSVTIDKIKTADITTKRGSVKINSVTDAKIETNVGKVTVEESLNSINVKTKRGNIVLGGTGIKMNNATVFTRSGKVNIKSASGTVDVETVSSNINFTNTDSQNIKIVCGKKLVATKLTGVVNIVANADTDLTFEKITNTTNIQANDSCKYIKVTAENNTERDTKFYFAGKSVVRYEDEAKVKEGTTIQNDSNVNLQAYIKIEGKNAEIHAYFKKP